MLEVTISYAALLSYLAFSADLYLQILKVHRRKSSADISVQGVAFRLAGSCFILLKFLTVKDPYLLAGQIVFTLIVAIYLWAVIRYRGSISTNQK